VSDAYFDDPLVEACQRYQKSQEWQAIRPLCGTGGAALDAGAGRGIASYALAREGFVVTALEPDPSHLVGAGAIRALARDTGLPITVVQEFSEQLPFNEKTFDVVFARAVLHHTKDLRVACMEFFRVLKPGGLLVAVREHVISRRKDLAEFLEGHPLHNLYGGENAFLLGEYTNALEEAGFVIRSVLGPLQSPINYFPHTQDSLRDALSKRLSMVPGTGKLWRFLLKRKSFFSALLRVLSLVDSRPGRLYSFVCAKPDGL
jgi:SAM-dependent methyltransferase